MDQVKAQFKIHDKNGAGRISESSLSTLIEKLCADNKSITKEVIQALFQSFDGGQKRTGSIAYNEFIDWLFESLGGSEKPAPAGAQSERQGVVPSKTRDTFNGIVKLFCSHQQTEECVEIRKVWLEGLQIDSVKASQPPFNVRLKIPWPATAGYESAVDYNIATFGVKLPRVIMDFFGSAELQKLSAVKGSEIPIPHYALDTFVQKKMVKVLECVAACREPAAAFDAESLKAVEKLEGFANGFTAIDAKKLTGPQEFEDFVHKHVDPGWEDKLHFDHVLGMFGFTKEVSDKIRAMKITIQEKDGDVEVTLEHHSLRWLTKAFRGYGPVGCLTDMVNLVYAVLKLEQPKEASEEAVIEAVKKLQDKMTKNDIDDLWIPTHLAHDAESDDALTWLLLARLHEIKNTRLQVLVQMPADPQQDEIAKWLMLHGAKPQVFRDKDSSNGKAVSNTWNRYLPKKD